MNKGEYGRLMAKQCFPSIKLVENGNTIDKMGVDAYEGNESIQIKFDERMSKTNNIYHEIYEKSINHPEQLWRNSPHKCDAYIYCTTYFVIKITTDALAQEEIGLTLIKISDTSIGFLIPIKNIPVKNYIYIPYK